jgi:hypothetical protein
LGVIIGPGEPSIRPLARVWTMDGKDIAEEIKRAGLEKER